MGIVEHLVHELDMSIAPVTQRHVACVIQTQKGFYGGHNGEVSWDSPFKHAESEALNNALARERNPEIASLFMAGKGARMGKVKNLITCPECFDEIRDYCNPQTQFTIFSPGKFNEHFSFNFSALEEAYRHFPYYKFASATFPDIHKELSDKTILIGRDLESVAALVYTSRLRGFNLYLFGSATGERAGASRVILAATGNHYNDIDLVVISQKPPEIVESEIVDILHSQYGHVSVEEIGRRTIEGYREYKNLKCGDPKEVIFSLTVAPKIGYDVCRKHYLERNWFYQLS